MTLQYVNRGDPIKADTINGLIDACSGPIRASTGGFYQTKDGPIFYDEIDWSPYNNDNTYVAPIIQRPWDVEIVKDDNTDNISVYLYNPTYIKGKKLHTAELSNNLVMQVPKSLSSDGAFMFCTKFRKRVFPSFLSGESMKDIWPGLELSDFNPRTLTDDVFLLSAQNHQDEILSADLLGMPSSQLVGYIKYDDETAFYFNCQPSFGGDNYNNLWEINDSDDKFENTYVMAGTELMEVDAVDIKPSQIIDGLLYVDIGLSSKVDTKDLSSYIREQNETDDIYIPIYLFEEGEVKLDFRAVPTGFMWSPIKTYMQKGEENKGGES